MSGRDGVTVTGITFGELYKSKKGIYYLAWYRVQPPSPLGVIFLYLLSRVSPSPHTHPLVLILSLDGIITVRRLYFILGRLHPPHPFSQRHVLQQLSPSLQTFS